MYKVKDMAGQKFGKLTVISRAENSINNKNAGMPQWTCLCDCGKNVVVYSSHLKNGNTKSCGCILGFSDKTLSTKNFLFYSYKQGAKKRGLTFSLNFEEFINITQQNCHYCNTRPTQYFKTEKAREGFFYNGIDRIDNSKGYDNSNIKASCHDCNWAKGVLSEKEYKSWIKKCYEHLKSKGEL
jgi:hypothetical protein